MKKITLVLLAIGIFSPFLVSAHPGNTASDGCHYCRTNCDRWGEAWNERHCHGGGSSYSAPTYNYSPTTYSSSSWTPTSSLSLSRGSVGERVRKLQEVLAKDPSIYPEGLVTGSFGPLTEQAVKRFQIKYGIDSVGQVGPVTRLKIKTIFGIDL